MNNNVLQQGDVGGGGAPRAGCTAGSTVTPMQASDGQLQHTQQGQPQQQSIPTANDQAGLLYDLSSFDPLQAHALQLTASAGLTTLLAAPAPNGVPQHSTVTNGDSSQPAVPHQQPQHVHIEQLQHQQQQQQQQPPAPSPAVHAQQIQQAPRAAPVAQAPQPPAQPPTQQPPPQAPQYYYYPPQTSATSTLQPIAPATQQPIAAQAPPPPPPPQPLVTPAGQTFLLPSTAQGTPLAVAPAFQQQIFPNTLAAAGAAPGMLPNILMSQHFQNVVGGASQPPQQAAPQPPPPPPAPQPQQLLHHHHQQQLTLMPSISSKKREAEDASLQQQRHVTKKREAAPSVISSSTGSTDSSGQGSSLSKGGAGVVAAGGVVQDIMEKPGEPQVDLDSMTPAERRRYERNLREQQRSYRISQQIKELRDVLSESNVPFKPNKYSILLSVVDYIKQLQARAIMLDAEHQKLITTIRQTNEMVNSGNPPSSADETDATNTTAPSETGSDNEMLFVQGLDYRSVFEQCPAALGIAALDGRILECNPEFQLLLGYPRDELLKQSLFNLVRNHQDIFRAMAEMLKSAEVPEPPSNPSSTAAPGTAGAAATAAATVANNRSWSGAVISKRDNQLAMNLTLTLGSDGSPKFFSCALTTT